MSRPTGFFYPAIELTEMSTGSKEEMTTDIQNISNRLQSEAQRQEWNNLKSSLAIYKNRLPEVNFKAIWANINFSGADLSEVDFSHLDLRGVCFNGANLSRTNFERTTIAAHNMENINFKHANFAHAIFFIDGTNNKKAASNIDFTGANFTSATINRWIDTFIKDDNKSEDSFNNCCFAGANIFDIYPFCKSTMRALELRIKLIPDKLRELLNFALLEQTTVDSSDAVVENEQKLSENDEAKIQAYDELYATLDSHYSVGERLFTYAIGGILADTKLSEETQKLKIDSLWKQVITNSYFSRDFRKERMASFKQMLESLSNESEPYADSFSHSPMVR